MDSAALRKLMVEVAKRDLGEDEKVREESIKKLKDWFETNPDIRNYNGDEAFLLIYLRKGKFSIPKAQELFLKMEDFRMNYPMVMGDIDVLHPEVNVFLKNGYVCASPITDDNGCQTIFLTLSKFNPSMCNYSDYIRAQVVTAMTMIIKEFPQVLGVVYVVDMANTTAAHATHIPLSILIPYMKAVQQIVPLRFKGFHFINMATPVKWIFDLIVSHATEKMKKRFMAHNSLEELHKHVSPRVLPQEYGGTMLRQEMIDWWYQEMIAARPTLIEWNNISVVQPANSDLKTSLAELPGSFKKLEVD